MRNSIRLMFSLIRYEICGRSVNEEEFISLTEQEWNEILSIAKRHELAHLVSDAALKCSLSDDKELITKMKRYKFLAVSHTVRVNACLEKCAALFSGADIPYFLLKGSVIRHSYPEEWMRVGADIDVLVPAASFEKAVSEFSACEGFRITKTTPHDISFTTREGITLELHHSLIESGRIGSAERLLDDIWDYAELSDGTEYKLCDELFYYYHLAHMAKHIERGGCGIRPFVDLWILNHRLPENQKREELLESGGLKKFADAAVALSEYWLGDGTADDNTLAFEQFIIRGGVFGTKDNEVLIKSVNHHGKWGYMLYKVWMPYQFLCCQYPELKGKRALQPVYEVRRWLRIVLKGNVGFAKQELETAQSVSEQMPEAEKLWRYLGF